MSIRLPLSVLIVGLFVVAATSMPLFAQAPTPAPEEGLPAPPSAAAEQPSISGPAIVAAEVQPAQECLPIHIVRDHYSLAAKRMIRCYGAPVQQTLCVENPANCCLYAVHVCVPSCCVGTPVCCGSGVGLLGRGYVVYQWPCGYKAEVVFRVHGGAIVNYK